MIKNGVDVQRNGIDRTLVAEDFKLINQALDAVGFIADQLGERPVVTVQRWLDELRSASDAGQGGS